jgi:hypothetical protein
MYWETTSIFQEISFSVSHQYLNLLTKSLIMEWDRKVLGQQGETLKSGQFKKSHWPNHHITGRKRTLFKRDPCLKGENQNLIQILSRSQWITFTCPWSRISNTNKMEKPKYLPSNNKTIISIEFIKGIMEVVHPLITLIINQ